MRRNKQTELHALLSEYGYTSVVATNCDQDYTRYLRPGDRVSTTTVIESISEEKATALGIGYFINTRDVFRDQHGEEVGWMTFRVLKFKPAPAAGRRPRRATGGARAAAAAAHAPPSSATTTAGGGRASRAASCSIQRCKACGALRHPPRADVRRVPVDRVGRRSGRRARARSTATPCSTTRSSPATSIRSSCAVIELDEGTRIVSNLVGCAPADVRIGMPRAARDRDRRRRDDAAVLPAGGAEPTAMDFRFSDEQTTVRDLARGILEKEVTPERLKRLEADGAALDRALWSTLADAGLLGLAVPAEHGGMGFGLPELCVLLAGARARRGAGAGARRRWCSAACHRARRQRRAAPRLARARSPPARRSSTGAFVDARSPIRAPRAHASATARLDRSTARSASSPRPTSRRRVLVPAATGDGVGIFLVDPKASGVTLARPGARRAASRSSTSTLAGVRVDDRRPPRRRRAATAPRAAARTEACALVALAATQVGVSERALEMTSAYVRERVQFGVPIGSFQAVQHRARRLLHRPRGDALGDVARGLAPRAAGCPPRARAPVAKFWAAEGGARIAAAAQHLHGGIGVDVDYPIHRYFLAVEGARARARRRDAAARAPRPRPGRARGRRHGRSMT